MRFVVDETSWCFDGLAQDLCIQALEGMLDRLDEAQAQGVLTCYSEDLFNRPVLEDKIFYDLYSPDSKFPIPRDVQERIASIFSGLPKWEDLPTAWPSTFDVQVGNDPKVAAPSIAWAHEQTVDNPIRAIACLVFPLGRPAGTYVVTVDGKAERLWFVADSQSYQNFFRWIIVATTKKPSEMEEVARSAFPSIEFVASAFNGIKDMSKPYPDLVECLVHHLGMLADHGQRIFRGPRDRVEAEFGALGINISDENGNTKSDKEARKARTLFVDGNEVVFWWHTKLERHQDRIHLNPEQITKDGKILVGIFCCHLK